MLWSFSFLTSKAWVPKAHQEEARRSSLQVFISEPQSPRSGSLTQISQRTRGDSTVLFLRCQRHSILSYNQNCERTTFGCFYVLMAVYSFPWKVVKSHITCAWPTNCDVPWWCPKTIRKCLLTFYNKRRSQQKWRTDSSQQPGTSRESGAASSADPVGGFLWPCLYMFFQASGLHSKQLLLRVNLSGWRIPQKVTGLPTLDSSPDKQLYGQ